MRRWGVQLRQAGGSNDTVARLAQIAREANIKLD